MATTLVSPRYTLLRPGAPAQAALNGCARVGHRPSANRLTASRRRSPPWLRGFVSGAPSPPRQMACVDPFGGLRQPSRPRSISRNGSTQFPRRAKAEPPPGPRRFSTAA